MDASRPNGWEEVVQHRRTLNDLLRKRRILVEPSPSPCQPVNRLQDDLQNGDLNDMSKRRH